MTVNVSSGSRVVSVVMGIGVHTSRFPPLNITVTSDWAVKSVESVHGNNHMSKGTTYGF